MAREFLTTARRHGAESAEVLACPGVPFATQLADFKERVAAGKTDPDFAEVQIWSSDSGVIKTAKFKEPTGDKPPAPKKAKKEKAAAEKKGENAEPAE